MMTERITEPNCFINLENHLVTQEDFALVFRSKQPNSVVITVPHDGLSWRNFIGYNLKERENGVKQRDKHVWPIAVDILNNSTLTISKQISAVRGLMPRKYVDYNRAYPVGINYYPNTQETAQTALDNEIFAATYHAYHNKVIDLVGIAIASHGNERALLLDLHGFAVQPPYAPDDGYDIILGTGNRVSVRHGDIDQKMGRYLIDLGYKVFLPRETTTLNSHQEDLYSADFTTRHYSERFNINAIQMEISPRFRDNNTGKYLGPKLSNDIANFLEGILD